MCPCRAFCECVCVCFFFARYLVFLYFFEYLDLKGSYISNEKKTTTYGQFLRSWISSPLKKYLSALPNELLPRKCWKLVFLASEWFGVFSKIYPELFPASPGVQLQEITSALFRSNWVKYDYNPRSDQKNVFPIQLGIATQLDRKSADGDSLQLGPWTSGITALGRPWRKLQVILRRWRPISNILGAKAHVNVLKGTFSTYYKSSIRIGLKRARQGHIKHVCKISGSIRNGVDIWTFVR